MNEQPTVPLGRRIVIGLALFAFLIGMPAMSYIYLKKGYDYQKEAIKDLRKTHRLEQYGQLTLLDGSAPKGEIFGDVHILGILPRSANTAYPLYSNVLGDLHEQFDLPENIEFWTIFEQQDSSFVANYQRTHELPRDTAQLLYWTAAERGYSSFVAQLGLTEEEQNWLPDGVLMLVDDSLYVRRAYSFNDPASLRQMVERIAMILPERKKPKPELRRKEEL